MAPDLRGGAPELPQAWIEGVKWPPVGPGYKRKEDSGAFLFWCCLIRMKDCL